MGTVNRPRVLRKTLTVYQFSIYFMVYNIDYYREAIIDSKTAFVVVMFAYKILFGKSPSNLRNLNIAYMKYIVSKTDKRYRTLIATCLVIYLDYCTTLISEE